MAIKDLSEAERKKLLAVAQRSLTQKQTGRRKIIPTVDHTGSLPLSYAQQRLWFLSRLEGGSRAYHMPFGAELCGKLDEVALVRALDRIVERHAVLRTTFELMEGEPQQRIRAHASFPLQRIDLRGDSDIDAAVRRQKDDEVNEAFDLEHGPLIRGRLLRQGDTAYTLLVTMHHIASDGWSMGVFFGELRALYAAFAQGEDDPLPALPLQYADYAVWQRTAATAERVEAQLQYWERQLTDAPTVLPLPWDRSRPAQQDYAGAIVPVALDASLSQRLKALSQREGTTLFMTVLAAWMAVLARLAREEDVVVGTVMANRGHTQIEGLIGFFVNTLAMRVQTDGALTVRELLARVKACALEAQQHQDIPFEQMVERVQPERSLAHSPIFQVMFAWQNNEGGSFELPEVEVRTLRATEHVMSKFDLTLAIGESADGIAGSLEYATALFDASTVQRMGVYLTTMLTAMVDDVGQAIGAIALLPASEREQVLYGWAEASRAQAETTVANVFARAAEHTLEALAATQIYLLDERGQPVPPGVVGEVHIGGAAVTRDHCALPSQHAERFLADPFSAQAHAWMYRTGELGVRKDGGVLVYAGTLEERAKRRQFKARQRELETLLKTHPDLADAVVMVWGDQGESEGLTAYVVPHAFEPTQTSALQKALSRYLRQQPSMPLMPTEIVTLERLPLMANGKVDRRALPIPEGDAYAGLMYEAPQGEIEEGLAAIWASLLKLERVGRHDHFFERGGHSLLGVRVVSAIRERFAVALEVRDLFSHPQLKELAQLVQATDVSHQQQIVAVDVTDPLPLSYAQQRLWFLSRLEGGSRVYHVPFGVELHGSLDEVALGRALNRIVQRHAVLRTTFELVDGEPCQRIGEQASFFLQRIDLRGASDIDAALQMQKEEEVNAAFDLEHGPVIRGRLLRQADTTYTLLVTMHHIASDGWSMGIFFGELRALYAAFAQGQDDPLPALPVQYADYAVWQRTAATAERVEAQLQYWERQLAGAPTVLALPWDRPRPAQQDYAGALIPVALDATLSQRLKALSQREGTTLFMTMLAAWMAVLARLAREEDVVVGTVMANRGHTQIEGLIGFFVNTLAMRVQTDGALTVRELLARVKACALEAQQHQDIPFEQMVERVQPERSLAHSPIFQTMFVWQNNENVALELPGIDLQVARRANHAVSRFDLTLAMGESAAGITGSMEYATALFDASTVQRMGAYLCTMLTAMVDDAGQAIGAIDLLPASEREQVLHGWNQTALPYPADQCIHQLFEQQVVRAPAATAVVFDTQTRTYAELNAGANRLAHELIARGVRPGDRLALCVERSIAMVEGILAILKAGGVYVPLDPAYPSARLMQILSDATPTLVLTDAVGRDALGAALNDRVTLAMDEADPSWRDRSTGNPDPHPLGLGASDLAYLIYTSGSTGLPKGVMVEHRNAVNLAQEQERLFTVTARSRVMQFASLNFDASIWEVLMTLSVGAALHVPLDAQRQGDRLGAYLAQEGITHVALPPALVSGLGTPDALHTIEALILAGESPDPAWIRRLRDRGIAVFNAYGVTEGTVCATVWSCPEGFEGAVVPIGRPIANTQIYLLDERRQPVPMGVAGEMYIGGAGVARGYLNQPELTAERFLPDPFSADAMARMYKTGDLARYLPDGDLQFLGRNDHQIKIRGFRIEPGEIEARLRDHAAVQEAVVVVREEVPGDKRLVAYWVAAETAESVGLGELTAMLRGHLVSCLPNYMVPAAFVNLNALPLTHNGKLDVQALPAPDDDAYARQSYVPPQGEIEQTLAALWEELLGVERVGRHDNFFELGGHSLLAVKLMERLRLSGYTAEVRALFTTPRLADLAATLGDYQGVVVPPNLITPDAKTITPDMLPLADLSQADIDRIVERVPGGVANVQDIYALSPLQDGILFHHLLVTGADKDPYLSATQMAFADRARLDRFLQAMQDVVDRHDILRTGFFWEGLSSSIQVVWRKAALSVTEVTLDADGGDASAQLAARFDSRTYRIDLSQAPLLRFVIARVPGSERWLLLQHMHHLIGDHFALETLGKEVQILLSGRADTLLAPEPFRNLVAQVRLGISEQEHERFFRAMLSDIDQPSTPFGLNNVHIDGTQVLQSGVKLPSILSTRLRTQARRLGISLASLCHVAWGQVIARSSGLEQVVFGTVLFGRMQSGAGADRTMGLFINTLPLRLDLDGTGVEACARQTQVRLAELLHHEHASLAMAQRCSAVDASLPLFNTLLNYRHIYTPDRVASESSDKPLDGIEWLGAEERSNYPLTLSVEDFGNDLGLTVQAAHPLSPELVCDYMLRTLEQLVEALEYSPGMPVRQLDILPPKERDALLKDWIEASRAQAETTVAEAFVRAPVQTAEALAATQIYLLDERAQPVPPGVVGEVYIGGAAVTRDHRAQPSLHTERLLADPFSTQAHAWMYRTGELGVRKDGGVLVYVGTLEERAKRRQFKIRQRELETLLKTHPDLADAVVMVWGDPDESAGLTAYVVPQAFEPTQTSAQEKALRRYLRQQPSMPLMPTEIMTLERLPLMANGKVDRRALPIPEGDAYAGLMYEAPQGEIEEGLAAIWSSLLKLERVGRHDHFFERGGHSLLAVRVVSAVRERFAVALEVRDLFSHPQLKELAEIVQAAEISQQQPIAASDHHDLLPLSYAQQRLWFLSRMDGGNRVYHIPFGVELHGQLDEVALGRALDRIVQRHAVLRTTFELVDGEPRQRIHTCAPFLLQQIDLREHADVIAAAQMQKEAEVNEAFDLERGPVIRGRLLRQGDTAYTLLVTMHHIASDGWSMGIFFGELRALYAAFAQGQDDPLPALPVQYADYAVWQRTAATAERVEAQLQYWEQQLAGAPTVLELPWDRPRPAQQDYAGAIVPVALDAALSQRLKALSQREGTTLFMTMLAAWMAVLARLAREEDVVVGTVMANRGHTQIEGLIGFFVNTLAMRVQTDGALTVRELLARVKACALEAQQHQDIPFEQMVERVQPERSLAHSPIFQVMFAWQNNEGTTLALPGVEVRAATHAEHVVSRFDLTLSLGETGSGIAGVLEYATALFDAPTVQRVGTYLYTMLTAMADDAGQTIGVIDLLSVSEREQVLHGWNATDRTMAEATLAELFERQAARTPDAIALRQGELTLSYRDLDKRTNRLAHYLRQRGVQTESRVAIGLQRGIDMVVCQLAILKAGGAYVPLDLSYPVERLKTILEGAQPTLVLTRAMHDKLWFALGDDSRVIDLDATDKPWEHLSTVSLGDQGGRDQLAYIIYTSGSTGEPRGVMVEHGAVADLVLDTDYVQFGPADVVAHVSNTAFDAATWEIWGALLNGASLVCVEWEDLLSLQKFGDILQHSRATALFLTTALFNQIAIEAPEIFAQLDHLLFGGELVNPERVREVLLRGRPGRLLHVYGPTETTTYASWFEVSDVVEGRTIPIGRPIANNRIYILDPHGAPVPTGVTGELYIGGTGVARGYLNCPALTAERFLADPFSARAGARMYRTGDLGRWLPDGIVEFLGRNDHQIKIRGFRIELGEIETRLHAHAAVHEAVVIAREDTPGEKVLVAYWVPASDARIDGEDMAAQLRTHLGTRLPAYMVPSAYVMLEALPLTPNGKIDRRALPVPDEAAYAGVVYEAPQGAIEEGLAAIWANLLKLEWVGRHDHFFERGGHSLLAVRVMSAVRERFVVALEVRDLFSHPQLKDLAQVIQGAEVSQQQQIVAVDTTDPLPLSYAQQRLWFLSRLDGGSRVYHMPFGVELHGQLDEVALGRVLDRIVARHAVLRTTFELVDGEPRQRIHAHASFAWQRIDLRGEADIEAAIRRQKNDEVNAAFDLEHGPVIRGRLLRQGDTAYTLLVTMHHIASDGWSMGIFFGELRALYAAFAQGQDDPLPALPVQYADYAVWQRTAATAERVEAQLQYWERQLAGAPTVLALPWDRPRPAQQDYAGAIVPVALDASLSQRLKALSQREGTTLFMTMLAAWMAVLARLAREEDVVVGTVMANRGHTQIEGLIGFFVNTLAMRVQTDGALTVRELLARVKACALEAQQHQDIPFEQMVERVQPERSLAHSPIFQVMFAWQNNEGTTLALPGVEVRAATHAEHVVSRFDLTLSLGEKAGAIMGMLEYATTLFDASTVQRMGAYLTTMLTAMVDDAGQAIGSIDLLSTTERVQVLAGWIEASRAQAETTVAEAFVRAPVQTAEALAATQIYLLDERAQPVPPGVVGEVYIGGAAVTRDHRAQPSLHTERLLADPFSTQAHAWMYRTGELGVRKDGGVLVYAGTLEERAKRRQFKVRQRELETLLKTHPDLADAVVTVWGDPDESAGLTAYVVPQAFEPTQTSAQEKALRRYLRQQPSMPLMPTAIVTLERLPLMANGKVDRRALPIPEGDAYAGLMYEAPQGEIEEGLAAIWANLLKLERVGRHDHFFERGGHSLLGVRVISAIRERFAVALEVRDLFSHPQLRDLAQVIQGAEVSQQQQIVAVDTTDPLPLSYAQQRLWFLSRLDGGSRVYHMPFGVELHGQLDEVALGRALDRIVERHAVLRTTFELVDGEPRQRVHASAPFALQRIDLRGEADTAATVRAHREAEGREAFDLERGPVIRGRLLRQGDTAYTLLVTMHHIASDGWSMGIFFGELRALYAAFAQGQDDPLPALPVQYADYAVWQRTAATAERVEAQLQYWERQLAGAPTVLALPWDRPRPAQQDYAGAIVPVALDASLSQRLKALSQREGTTLFMTMLAAWMAVLARLAREEDVVVGTVMANRGHTQIEGLIGFFVNTLAMRVQTDGALTVRELLARVKACALEAQQHQDIPFEQMVERVQPERSLAHSPIFQVMFAWQNNESVALELPGVELRTAKLVTHGVSRLDLTLSLGETAQGIAGVLEYATALFDASTVQRMGAYLCTMLTAMVDDAGQAIGAIDLLSSSEREQVLHGWNATERAMAEGTLTDGFEQQVQRTPEAIAIREDAQTLSYRDLDARANQVAQRLIAEGVRAGQVVAVALPRSIDLVVVFLGVLKAGAVYLSLDPENPPERQAFLLADARPVRLITRRTLWSVWPEGDTGWDWTEQAPRCAQASSARPARDSDAMDAAYIIYTSGSTGTPKGVVVPHQAVVRVVQDNGFATLHSDDRMAFACNPTFDVSMLEIWAPLLAGACIVVVAQDTLLAPERLKAWLTEARVTAMWLTVGLFNQYAEALMEVFARLRYLLVGGDALDPRTIERVLQQGRPQHLLNGYGPTEATILATTHRIEEVIGGRSIPIGRPVANTRMYVLDERRQPVPVGVLGELYIGGKAVALGYWNREALTAERFVADPFSPHADARMYKTGDLGRWLPDGTLEYGGRNDFQVKVRGYRIELGEIEARLHEHEAVHETVVIARADSADEKRLVAYWVPAPGTRSDGEDKAALLRAHLGTRLPAYMVPSAYVMLEALPLTRNGKIDRRALPVPDGEAYAGMVYEAPQGEVEETLAQIWSDLLKVEQVGRHDHFFHLGGHSLLAVRVVSAVRERFAVALEVRDLFSHPQLKDLARVIHTAEVSQQPYIEAATHHSLVPLSYAQQRLWFLSRLEGASRAYHMPFGVELHGTLDEAALVRALDRIVERHAVLRTTFELVDGEPRQRIHTRASFALQRIDLRDALDIDAAAQMHKEDEVNQGFDLEHDPVIRGRLLRHADAVYTLLVTMHHIASDGWSMGIFFGELRALYTAFAQGQDDPLPAMPLQYTDYAIWQRTSTPNEKMDAQLHYWERQLAGAPTVLELPWDRPRPAQQDYAGAMVPVALDASLSQRLKTLSQREGATLFMTVLAAWMAVLSRLTREEDVVVGTLMANRRHTQIEGLIGFFVNTLAMRVQTDGSLTVRELLKRVKACALEAQQHQDIPFEQVVERIQPERSLAHSPIFQTMFVWQNNENVTLELPGVQLHRSEPAAHVVSRFDLTLAMSESANGIVGALEYATALFDATTVQRMGEYLCTMLTAMVDDAEQEIGSIDLLSAQERAQVLQAWNSGRESTHDTLQALLDRPLAQASENGEDTQIYLLDDRCQPVPVGVVGDIYLGGVGSAVEHMRDTDDMVGQVFPNPFSTQPFAWMYRTGDLGRCLQDGTTEFWGRSDERIKIRGYRIELGEIESRLQEADGVREAVVLAHDDEGGKKQLVAYYTMVDDADVSDTVNETLRAHLSDCLPEYMVPMTYARLCDMPRLSNGKVDREAMPAPDASAYAKLAFEEPQGELEHMLADVWSALLKVDRISRNDHFFHLGGHSMLCVQALFLIQQRCDARIALRDMFQRPILKDIAYLLANNDTKQRRHALRRPTKLII